MILKELLKGTKIISVTGDDQQTVNGLCFDSRKAGPGIAFIAVKGTVSDGHSFIADVISKACTVIICQELPSEKFKNVCIVQVEDSHEAVGIMASNFYGNPSEKLSLVAVTGTNGKTTVSTILFRLFRTLGYHAGLLSTVQNQIDEAIIPATHTTPDAIALNELLAKMVSHGCDYCFMEASSHAIHQKRIAGLIFAGAVFTNITHDHLDYHVTFEHYLKAKKALFDSLPSTAFALTNKDDKNGPVMLQNTKATRVSYALQSLADFRARIIESDFNGMLLNIDDEEAWFRLVGKFNAYNLLAAYGAAFLLGKKKEEIITALSRVEPVAGRFDFHVSKNKIVGIVDYAHTPDALKNILSTINEIRTKNEKVITVVGCGGNRDSAKRPVMASVACEMSDKVILTSDNPRNENPEEIINEMQKGVSPVDYKKTLRITDRREAIKAAVNMAEKGDIILLAGKGHESYQEIQGVKHPFDDREILRETLELFEK